MSLRVRIFLIFGGLIALLSLAQWLLVRSLTRDIDREANALAVSLGRDMATVLDMERLEDLISAGKVEFATGTPEVSGHNHLYQAEKVRFKQIANGKNIQKAFLHDVEFRVPSSSGSEHVAWQVRKDNPASFSYRYNTRGQDIEPAEINLQPFDGPHEKSPRKEQLLRVYVNPAELEEIHVEQGESVWAASATVVKQQNGSGTTMVTADSGNGQVTTWEFQTQSNGHETESEVLITRHNQDESVERMDGEEPLLIDEHADTAVFSTSDGQRPVKIQKQLWISSDQGSPAVFHFKVDEQNDPGLYELPAKRRGVVFLDASPDLAKVDVRLESKEDASFLVLDAMRYSSRIPLTKNGMSDAVNRLSQYLVGGSLLLLLIGLLAAGFLAHRITRPLTSLAMAAREVGEGHLGSQVRETDSDPDIQHAIQAFNGMSLRLVELDALERQNRERRYMADMGEIARGLAHTIRNPLNTLGLSLEQMASMLGNRAEANALVDTSRRQIGRIDRWIRSFLALAADGKGQRDLLNLGSLVEDVTLEAMQDNPGKVRFSLDLEPSLPNIYGIAAELRAVIQAIVVNAVEASPKGDMVHVSVSRMEQGGIEIVVEDRGPGLAPTVRKKLFTPHVTTKPQGSGMGLFLAHRITNHRYGGSLKLEDGVDGGTRAFIQLPERSLEEVEANAHFAD